MEQSYTATLSTDGTPHMLNELVRLLKEEGGYLQSLCVPLHYSPKSASCKPQEQLSTSSSPEPWIIANSRNCYKNVTHAQWGALIISQQGAGEVFEPQIWEFLSRKRRNELDLVNPEWLLKLAFRHHLIHWMFNSRGEKNTQDSNDETGDDNN